MPKATMLGPYFQVLAQILSSLTSLRWHLTLSKHRSHFMCIISSSETMSSSDSFITQCSIAIKQSQTVRGRRIDSSSLTMHGEPNLTTSAHHRGSLPVSAFPIDPLTRVGPISFGARFHRPGLCHPVTTLATTCDNQQGKLRSKNNGATAHV